MENRTGVLNIIGWVFGFMVLTIGIINVFWGNDQGFGVFLVVLSFIYFPPVNAALKQRTRLYIPKIVKVGLAIFILWAALGVGELFDKVKLMLMNL